MTKITTRFRHRSAQFGLVEYEYHSGNSTLSDWFQYHWAADFSFEPDSDLYGVDVFENWQMYGREVVDIAFLYDMSGPISIYSSGFEASAEIAMDYMNSEQDEYWYNVVGFDSGCDGTVAAEAAIDAIEEGIELVIGPLCSGASMAANSVLSAAGVPHVSPTSTSPAPPSPSGRARRISPAREIGANITKRRLERR